MKKKIFLIGEIGINHNGSIDIAKKLIDVAVKAKLDSVKFQKRNIYKVYTKKKLASYRDSPWGKTEEDQKKGLEFGEKEYKEIDSYCKSKNIIWFASAWDLDSLNFLDKFNLKYNKIASAMIKSEKFLNEVASKGKHTFISTGMSEMKDIEKAVEIFRKKKCSFELMHCVSKYPAEAELVNLNCIKTLKDKFKCEVGYSGHEKGIVVSAAAVSFGITSLERHITIDRTMYGSDQAASIEPNGLITLVQSVRKVENALGDGVKIFHDQEIEVAKKLREHIDNI